jgi:hypothetical protein
MAAVAVCHNSKTKQNRVIASIRFKWNKNNEKVEGIKEGYESGKDGAYNKYTINNPGSSSNDWDKAWDEWLNRPRRNSW